MPTFAEKKAAKDAAMQERIRAKIAANRGKTIEEVQAEKSFLHRPVAEKSAPVELQYEFMSISLSAAFRPDAKKLRKLLEKGWEIVNQSTTAQALGFGKQMYTLKRLKKTQ